MKFDIEKAKKLHKDGLSYRFVAKKMGIAYSTLREYLSPRAMEQKKIRDKRNNAKRQQKCKDAIKEIKISRGGKCDYADIINL